YQALNLIRSPLGDIEKFASRLNSVKELTLSFAESFFAWLKSELKNSEAIIRRKGTTLKNIGISFSDYYGKILRTFDRELL
ncbi:MAG: hypothetical protein LBL16_01580, partial [Endomicrobium sp.]|nr:hypothetical protein [Endomicrobium sp.]